MKLRPAVRIIFAPIAFRRRTVTEKAEGKRVHGEADKANRTIWIDPRLDEVGATLFHELTHIKHPDWSEETVTAYEKVRWGKMGWKEKARYYQMLGNAKLQGEPGTEGPE